jgi:hypothetical protein
MLSPPAAPALPAPAPSAAEAPTDEALPAPVTTTGLPSTRVSTRASAPKDGEDPALVLQAIQALRNHGDAGRASGLLAEYLAAHPRGVLSEDALALSIEAANARHDTRGAAELGRRYLAQFPAGRYRAFALQSTQSPAR